MSNISQKEFAKMLLNNGWQCITYTYDTTRHNMEYEGIDEGKFNKWWSEKGNKVWFKSLRTDDISVKFDYERIMVWFGNSNPVTYEYEIPMEEVARLVT